MIAQKEGLAVNSLNVKVCKEFVTVYSWSGITDGVKTTDMEQPVCTSRVYYVEPVMHSVKALIVMVYLPTFLNGSAVYHDTFLPDPLLPKKPEIQVFVEIE